MKSAAVYVRISSDPRGTEAGVGRQLADCKAWADRTGAVIAQIYQDNDKSAYSGKPRPAYIQMCDDLKQGSRDGVIVWHPDRLHRSPRELEDFIDLMEASGAQYHSVTGGDYDLATPQGRMFARMLGAVARHESEDKSRRIARKQVEMAQQGRRSGGGTRGYGYNAAHDKIIPKEAAIIKEATERILAGDSLRSVTADLNNRNIPTVQGGPWSTSVISTMLTSARISGQREHHGEIISTATWPAIITPNETARLRSILRDPARRTNRSPRSYPLTGLLRCGLCDAKLVARPRGDGARCYVCASGPNFWGCGKIRQLSEPLEEFIAEAILERLDSPLMAQAIISQSEVESDARPLEEALHDDRLQLDELADMYGRKELSAREWTIAKAPIQNRILENERRLSSLIGTSALDGFMGHAGALREQWSSLDAPRQRAIVGAMMEFITIGPAVKGRNFFDPARVTPKWRG